MTYEIERDDQTNEFDDKEAFENTCDLLDQNGVEYTTNTPDAETPTDGGVVVVDESPTDNDEPRETQTSPDMNALAQNPIEWLRGVNPAYVNTIKNTPAISKRGFRYIQSQFGITTRSEIVKWVDDPLGVVIWAKAELPDGRSAEAHGEAYQNERKLDDNEFVRYGDTRAKNRALADLTSSGALCVEEMEGGD